MANKKTPISTSSTSTASTASTAPHDSLAQNRLLPVVPADTIPKVPKGFVATDNDERMRRLTRPAESLRAEHIVALGQVIARKATYRSELGDVPPDVALAEILHPRLTTLQASREAAEALVVYLRELEEIAYSDAADYLQAVNDEVVHRVRKNSELATSYSSVLLISQARRQAIAEGRARALRDTKEPAENDTPPSA